MGETFALVLAGKHLHKPRSKLEAYDETYIFIPVDIIEDVVKSIAWKRLGILVPVCADSKSL